MTLADDIILFRGLLGGLLIGTSALLLLLGTGRIAGISGIAGGLTRDAASGDRAWRAMFMLGLLAGAATYLLSTGSLEMKLVTEGPALYAAAALVGIGTRLGQGCTSGHGVCGLGRRSPRSLVATITFMAVAIITVFIIGGVAR